MQYKWQWKYNPTSLWLQEYDIDGGNSWASPLFDFESPILKMKGQAYSARVLSAMMYVRRGRSERSISWSSKESKRPGWEGCVVWACLKSTEHSTDLRKVGLEVILDVLRRRTLRWNGHEMRRGEAEWIRRFFQLQVDGKTPMGRRLSKPVQRGKERKMGK